MREELLRIAQMVELGDVLSPQQLAAKLRALAEKAGAEPVGWAVGSELERALHRKDGGHGGLVCMAPEKCRADMVAIYTAPPSQPVADREAARARFPDPAFQRWLDEGISDAGHTVFCTIGDAADAWAGWSAKDYYAQPVALPDGWVAVPRRWTREMLDAFYRFCPNTNALYVHSAIAAAIAAAPAGEGVGDA